MVRNLVSRRISLGLLQRMFPKVQETAGVVSLQTTTTFKTHNDWNADTGAISHMTPHYHWFVDYKPYELPIKLADNIIVYSAGVRSVVFNIIIKGRKCHPVQFTRVTHVHKPTSSQSVLDLWDLGPF